MQKTQDSMEGLQEETNVSIGDIQEAAQITIQGK